MSFDINKVRSDFPILLEKVYAKPLVYLDNGATTQKPLPVIDCINNYYFKHNSTIHRGIHFLSEQSTENYELARKTIQQFIHARHAHEIIFTSGTTGSINAIAFSFGEAFIKEDDEIIISEMEHHANIVPWQMLCERKQAKLKVIPINDLGELELDKLDSLFSKKTRLMAITYVSNALGTVNPVKKIIQTAHRYNVPVLIDGAQAVQHIEVDVQQLDCDFFVFSGHKIYGPTGIGVLYGKEQWLEKLPPYQGGGDMVDVVSFEKTTYGELPFKFEAGTTNYIGAAGLQKAIAYLSSLGLDNIAKHETEVLDYATNKLSQIPGIKIYGKAAHKVVILSFLLDNIHAYDTGMIIDKMGIAVRTGTHCAQPVMQKYGIDGTIRASLGLYNTKEEIDRLIEAILKAKELLS